MAILKTLLCCQSLLRAGYESIQSSGPEWLRSLCDEFQKFCGELQPFLFDMQQSIASSQIDDCLLCCAQIVNCLGWLEQTLRVESTEKRVLSVCRQHFLDRITWCIDMLTKSIQMATTAANIQQQNEMDMDFVTSMDYALELVEPLTMFGISDDGEPSTQGRADINVAATRDETMLTGQRIRAAVNTLISHALTFANVAMHADRKPLATVCQTALKQCIAFENATSLAHTQPCDVAAQMCATALEQALYQLDSLLNDCLLRLVYAAFAALGRQPLQRLRRLIASAAPQDVVDEHIARFDEMSDRLQQIGVYAAAFASNRSIRTRIRSALASAESLDSVLVAALLSPTNSCEPNVRLLERHWTREMQRLQAAVQSVIDTRAFCDSLYDQLTAVIADQRRQIDRKAVHAWLDNCSVLLQHLHANRAELLLNEQRPESGRTLLHNDLGLMLDECRAAADACATTEWRRVVKRLQIMQHVLKRFGATLKDAAGRSESGERDRSGALTVPLNQQDKDEPSIAAFFRQAGISSRVSSVLYASGRVSRSRGGRSSVVETKRPIQLAIVKTPSCKSDEGCKSSRVDGNSLAGKRRLTKKSSLRTTMFKRLPAPDGKNSSTISLEASSVVDFNESLDLHITEILEQITDLSKQL